MRYSEHRGAFVLRAVGHRFGPVIVRRSDDAIRDPSAAELAREPR
ncbi:MAG: hypothetical protein ACR2NR_08685 [Solirubrobacteraceae bacterium]